MGIAGEHRFTGLDGADQAWCSCSREQRDVVRDKNQD